MSTIYSVYQINNYIKNMIRQDILLSGSIKVQGEVSNCKDHSTGLYFTLKDENAVLSCVMFKSDRAGLAFSLSPGDKVTVTGKIDTYPKNGQLQLYAKKIEKSGAGELYERFLKLKEKLSDMGVFSDMYKQEIPKMASRIGVVTAPSGAVIQDIKNVSKRRHPGVEIFLYPALVQGENAAPTIVKGIEVLDQMGLDVIIVGRGGGSIEDLWPFNEEEVAMAIFNAQTPIVSAVGHETDWTIADFAADLRAPTPSAAAELCVPDFAAIIQGLYESSTRLDQLMSISLESYKRSIREYKTILEKNSPNALLFAYREKVNSLNIKLDNSINRAIENAKRNLLISTERLEGLSPLKKLKQGYSFVNSKEGKQISSVFDVGVGDELCINVTDGEIIADVKSKREIGR